MPKVGLIPTVRFNLKRHDKEKDSNKEVLISLVFRYNGKKLVYSTGLKAKPKEWRKDKVMVPISKNVANSELNKKLSTLRSLCEDIFKNHNYGEIELSDFKKELDYRFKGEARPEEKSDIPTLMEFFDLYIKERKELKKSNVYDKVNTIKGNLELYQDEKKVSLNYDDIDWAFKASFEAFLYAAPRKQSQNTVNKSFKIIKQVMREAKRRGYHSNEIALDIEFRVKRVKVKNKVRFNENEVKIIMGHDLKDQPHLDKTRDLFVAACYCGLRISDWSKINKSHITDRDGILRLKVMTQKTKSIVTIPIKKELLTILEKYNYELPTIESQSFNIAIKKVVNLALPESTFLRVYNEGGITKDEIARKGDFTSSHAGRRTFASNRYMEGWALRTIKNILGHATEAQTEDYMDISDDELSDREARLMQLSEMAQTLRAVKVS